MSTTSPKRYKVGFKTSRKHEMNKFGEFCQQIIANRRGEQFKDIALVLGINNNTLSCMCSIGMRPPKEEYVEVMKEHYELDKTELAQLQAAVDECQTKVVFDLTGADKLKRAVVLNLKRRLDDLPEQVLQQILDLCRVPKEYNLPIRKERCYATDNTAKFKAGGAYGVFCREGKINLRGDNSAK